MPTDLLPGSHEPSHQSSLNKRLVSEQIFKLLSHYWLVNEDDALRRAQVSDWIADFEEFPASIVAGICEQWRRAEEKRPSIAALRKLCLEYVAAQRAKREPPRGTQPEEAKAPDHVVRDYWRKLHVRQWSKSELETANLEMTALAHKYGFNTGDDKKDRLAYAKASLNEEVPPYDCETGREGKMRGGLKSQCERTEPAPEIF